MVIKNNKLVMVLEDDRDLAEKSGKDLRNTSLTVFMCISRCLWERRHCILDKSIRSRLFIRITHGMKTTCIIFRFSEKSRQGCGEKS